MLPKTRRGGDSSSAAAGNLDARFSLGPRRTSNVTASAAKARITQSHVYKTRRSDPDFARRWQAALCEG